MTTITILPENLSPTSPFRAIAGSKETSGKTAGEALDAISSQLQECGTTLVILQTFQSDPYFTAQQQKRLAELMIHWRLARDSGSTLSAEDEAELNNLVAAEIRATSDRAAALANGLAQ